MAMTWNQLAALPAGQVAALNGFAALGAQVQSAAPGTVNSIVPPDTYSHAKSGQAGIADLRDLVAVTMLGVNFTLNYYRKQAQDAFDAANP